MKRLLKDSQGMALVLAVFVTAILLAISGASLLFSQLDLKMASNHKLGTQAFYIADAGLVRGENWLIGNQDFGAFPYTVPENFGVGRYTVTINRYTPGANDGKYRITSEGLGPNSTKRAIEAIMKHPNFNPFAAINIDGDGTHADFNDNSGGTGSRIPSFNIDGRDHTADGTALVAAPSVSSLAGTQSGANTDITIAVDNLKQRIVQRANHNNFCGGNAPNPAGPCTPGLYRVYEQGLSENCNQSNPGCYKNLDLSDPKLRAIAVNTSTSPPAYTLPASPDSRGPFSPITNSNPLVRELNATEASELRQAIRDITAFSNASPASKKNCISGDIRGGTHTFGTPSNPMITFIGDPCSDNPTYVPGGRGPDLEVRDGAVVNGVGILIVPRRIRLRDATFNWQGIVMVLEDGDFRVGAEGGGNPSEENSCGAINGTVILQDDHGNDPKLDMDKVGPGSISCRAFSVNLSRAAIKNALKLLLVQVSWVEKF